MFRCVLGLHLTESVSDTTSLVLNYLLTLIPGLRQNLVDPEDTDKLDNVPDKLRHTLGDVVVSHCSFFNLILPLFVSHLYGALEPNLPSKLFSISDLPFGLRASLI